MTTSNVRKIISHIKEDVRIEAYYSATKILVSTYLMLGENFAAFDPDFNSTPRVSFSKTAGVLPRKCSTVLISQVDFEQQVPKQFDSERLSFATSGKAFFEERYLDLEFNDRVCSWVVPLKKSGFAALVPSVAREIVDRIYPQHNTSLNSSLPIFNDEVESSAHSLGIIKPLLTTLRYVWENDKPMLCSLKNGHYSNYEIDNFHVTQDIKF